MSNSPVKQDSKVLLVVGDWFVDENWVCGVHRSSTSSRTGHTHLRALHATTSMVRAFCGAGRSAQFLHHLYRPEEGDPGISLVGLGFWHRADTEALTSLFNPDSPAQTPYRLTPATPVSPRGIELINMNDALNFKPDGVPPDLHQQFRDKREYTTRVIRIYTRGAREKVKYDRLDWERKTPRKVPWSRERLDNLTNLLKQTVRERRISGVLIKDMQKGVVTDDILTWLLSLNLGPIPWFISSKRWWPDWLKDLGLNVDLRLLMIPQVAADTALRNKSQNLSRWITRSGRPSGEAIEIMDKFASFSAAKNIFVLPDGFSALACKCENRSIRECVVQSDSSSIKPSVDMGFASILFPTLVACLQNEQTQEINDRTMNLTLGTAYEWVEAEAKRVLDPERWNPNPETWNINSLKQLKSYISDSLEGELAMSFGKVKTHSWAVERREWEQAVKDVGIVESTNVNDRRLELWRAMLEVDGYVCCQDWARKELRELIKGVQSFGRNPRHHASCMLIASPGSGKTFLAKRLAETAHLRFIPFNITQMRSKGDLLECLDTIVATQAETTDQPLMVFIDEINARLENAPIYAAFLTPLEDGTYVRSGRTFNIKPCVWVFAGTRHPKQVEKLASASDESTAAEKGSDFVSRLTLGVMNITKSKSQSSGGEDIYDQGIHATERVYLGAAMLRQEFPDVRYVSELVLRAFWDLPHNTTVREIKHFVRRFGDIQYGEVTARSVPEQWPGDPADHKWREWKEKATYSDVPDVAIIG